jgi:hypothetical protein
LGFVIEKDISHPALGDPFGLHPRMSVDLHRRAQFGVRINSCTTLTSLPVSASNEL